MFSIEIKKRKQKNSTRYLLNVLVFWIYIRMQKHGTNYANDLKKFCEIQYYRN